MIANRLTIGIAGLVLLAGCGRQDFEGLWTGAVCEAAPMEMDLDSWGRGMLHIVAPVELDNPESALVEVDLEIEVTQDFKAFVEPLSTQEIWIGAVAVKRQVMTGDVSWLQTEYPPCDFEIARQ